MAYSAREGIVNHLFPSPSSLGEAAPTSLGYSSPNPRCRFVLHLTGVPSSAVAVLISLPRRAHGQDPVIPTLIDPHSAINPIEG